MAFPETPLGARVELDLGDRWEDITPFLADDRIVITRGQRDEAPRVDPSTCTLTLNNADGRFTWRNPTGPYYGKIGRNTPVRISVGAGEPYVNLPGGQLDNVSTPDAPELDITGDLDIRMDLRPTTWQPGTWVELAGKYANFGGVNQRSWMLFLDGNGTPWLRWSPDGVTLMHVGATAAVRPPASGRMTLRATLDVDNGNDSHTVQFYTGPSVSGPWTQLGTPATGTGTTSVFASTTPLEIGDVIGTSVPPDNAVVAARLYRFQLRAGLDGPVVADLDTAGLTPGATSWTDRAGRTWSVGGKTTVENWYTRFYGEVSTWPTRWGPSGYDAAATITASGILRRLSQGTKPLESTLRRRIPSFNPVAYWPMEEDRDASQAYSPIPGVRPMRLTDVQMGADDSLPGGSALPTLGPNAAFSGTVPSAPAGEWHVELVYRLDQHPTSIQWLLDVHTTGAMRVLHLALVPDGIQLIGEDDDGKPTMLINGTAPNFTGRWARLRLYARSSGGTTTIYLTWITVGGSGLEHTATYTGSPGRVTRVAKPGENGTELQGMSIGHIAVFSHTLYTGRAFAFADHGFTGETAADRIARLCEEEGVPVRVIAPEGSAAMGPQRPGALVALLEECAQADGGLLAEDPERLGLTYRARTTVYNQPVKLPLRYGQSREVQPPLEPVDDDLHVRNDVTRTRPSGSTARAVRETGRLSVQPPPAGVGRYDDTDTVNVATDAQLAEHAGWALHLGTVDEPRYPQINLNLAKAPHLIPAVVGLGLRDRLTITGAPPQWAPGTIDQLVQGWTETLRVREWTMQLDCVPASPWTVGVVEDEELGRVDTAGTVLASAVTATASVLEVRATAGEPWTTDPADYPLDLAVGGEMVTVSSTTHAAQDTYTRTVTGGWGAADSGQTWTTTGGSPSDYYVQGA